MRRTRWYTFEPYRVEFLADFTIPYAMVAIARMVQLQEYELPPARYAAAIQPIAAVRFFLGVIQPIAAVRFFLGAIQPIAAVRLF